MNGGPKSSSWGRWALGSTVTFVVVALVLAVTVVLTRDEPIVADGAQPEDSATVPDYGPQQVLMTDLYTPYGVAVGEDGDVYVADSNNHRVMRYPAGSTAGTELPFGDIFPTDIAVDGSGNVYVADTNDVFKLAPDAAAPTALPLADVENPSGIAVDRDGRVYVGDDRIDGTSRVLELTPDATAPTELPFDGLRTVRGVAVDGDGTVYAVDFDGNTLYELARGASAATKLPFGDRSWLNAIAVDAKGTLYVGQTDLDGDDAVGRVWVLPEGAKEATALPFSGLRQAEAVAVDAKGNVYAADGDPNAKTGRIVELPVR